jgi:hypothetical protein
VKLNILSSQVAVVVVLTRVVAALVDLEQELD